MRQTCYSVPFISNQQYDHNQELKSTYKAKWSFSNTETLGVSTKTWNIFMHSLSEIPLEHSQTYFKLSRFIMWFPETCVNVLCLIANNVTKSCLPLSTKAWNIFMHSFIRDSNGTFSNLLQIKPFYNVVSWNLHVCLLANNVTKSCLLLRYISRGSGPAIPCAECLENRHLA